MEEKVKFSIERRLEDLNGLGGFHIRAGGSSTWMDYEVRILVLHDDGEGEPLKFQNANNDITLDPEKAEIYLYGDIRWDGCSHNNFTNYIHGCSRQEMTRLGRLFETIFDIAMEIMPGNGEYLS